MKFRQPNNCHNHPLSLDSASPVDSFIKRDKELGAIASCITDHGSLGGCMDYYNLCKKNDMIPILGVEGYLYDPDCDILKRFGIQNPKEYAKYMHFTLHCKDEEAYKVLSKKLSHAEFNRAEWHGSEKKPLFVWEDLEEICSHNVTLCSSCMVGVVGRHLMSGRPDIAEAYYQKIRSLVPSDDFYVELFPHVTSHNWVSGVFITLANGEKLKFHRNKKLKIGGDNHLSEWTAEDLVKAFQKDDRDWVLEAIRDYHTWREIEPQVIVKAEVIEDFIQNDCSPHRTDGDWQTYINEYMLGLSKKYGDKCLVSLDSHYATSDYKEVQDMKLLNSGGSWRFFGDYSIKSSNECYDYFSSKLAISAADYESWVENSYEWANKFKDFKFSKKNMLPTSRYPADTLAHFKQLIEKHGRMQWDSPAHVERLKSEIVLLHKNGTIDLLPYFFVEEEVIDAHEQESIFTGPGRGSAAGLLTTYLLGITHLDPLKYELSQDRFLTLDRIASGGLPDIDSDFADRSFLVGEDGKSGWLSRNFPGAYAQIGTLGSIKLKNAIRDVFRATHGEVWPTIEKFAVNLPNEPQGVSSSKFLFGYEDTDGNHIPGLLETDRGVKEFSLTYPNEWEKIIKAIQGIFKSKGRHASAWAICEGSIDEVVPLCDPDGSGIRVTQYTMGGVESAGVLKFDFLTVSALKDIQDCIKNIQVSKKIEVDKYITIDGKKVPGFRAVPFGNKLYDAWALPELPEVFKDICEGKTETVFQFCTTGAIKWLREFNYNKPNSSEKLISSIEDMAIFTALDRPGPLDAFMEDEEGDKYNMLQEYARRARGITNKRSIKALDTLIPKTNGILIYQEDLTRVFQKLAGVDGITANEFRSNIGKKKMEKVIATKPKFMAGAVPQIGEYEAEMIWDQMVTFGQYGFNKSHAICYAYIGYVCAFLKHFYPLEWWGAVLKNAEKDEIAEKFWRHCSHLVDMPDINESGDMFEIRDGRIRAPLGFLKGVGAGAHEELCKGRPYKDLKDFCTKIQATKVAKTKVNAEGKSRKGTSALNKGVVTKLIVSGVMDSLFPPDTDLYCKLDMYSKELAAAEGKKKVDAVDEKYVSMNPLALYQLRKEILAIYGENLIPKLSALSIPEIVNMPVKRTNGQQVDSFRYLLEKGNSKPDYLFVNSYGFEKIDNDELFPTPVRLALIGYITDSRKFYYQGRKEALEVNIDVNSDVFSFVKWGRGAGGKLGECILNPEVGKDLNGAIAILLVSKYNKGSRFGVDGIHIVQPPLTKE